MKKRCTVLPYCYVLHVKEDGTRFEEESLVDDGTFLQVLGVERVVFSVLRD